MTTRNPSADQACPLCGKDVIRVSSKNTHTDTYDALRELHPLYAPHRCGPPAISFDRMLECAKCGQIVEATAEGRKHRHLFQCGACNTVTACSDVVRGSHEYECRSCRHWYICDGNPPDHEYVCGRCHQRARCSIDEKSIHRCGVPQALEVFADSEISDAHIEEQDVAKLVAEPTTVRGWGEEPK